MGLKRSYVGSKLIVTTLWMRSHHFRRKWRITVRSEILRTRRKRKICKASWIAMGWRMTQMRVWNKKKMTNKYRCESAIGSGPVR